MSLDGQSKRFIDMALSGPFSHIGDHHPAQLRQVDSSRYPVDQAVRKELARTVDRTIDGPNGAVPLRVYYPKGSAQNPPVVVYFHGGGFGVGSIDVYDTFAVKMCRDSGCIVVSVEYRLAPENKFPKGLEDAYAAYAWTLDRGAELGTTSKARALVGDSAGGALVASVTLLARARGIAMPDYQVLIYPMTSGDLDTESRQQLATGYLPDRPMITYYMRHYVGSEAEMADPLVTPALADSFAGLPPALIITAEFDPLRDDGRIYGEKLRAAGVDVIFTEYGRTVHGFLKRPGMIEKGNAAVAQIGSTLRSALGRGWDAE